MLLLMSKAVERGNGPTQLSPDERAKLEEYVSFGSGINFLEKPSPFRTV